MDVSHINLQPDRILSTLSLHLERAERTMCGTDWVDELTVANPVTRVWWVVGGEGEVDLQGEWQTLRPGRLYLIPAHTPFRHRCAAWMDVYWVHLTAQVLSGLDPFALFPWPQAVPVTEEMNMPWVWQRLLAAYHGAHPARQLLLDGLLRLVLAPLLQSAVVEHSLERFAPVLAYIEERLEQRISNAELAELINLQPVYFANSFSRAFGIGPQTYLIRRRIARAATLLGEGSLPLQSIAAATGFNDVFYFSRMFKKVTGMAPGQYRKEGKRNLP